jgi:hypothetical protein
LIKNFEKGKVHNETISTVGSAGFSVVECLRREAAEYYPDPD